jgi:oligopeptidase B
MTTGIKDPRVGYWEPAKFLAKLKKYKTDQNPLLLKTQMSAGHFGKMSRFEVYKEYAEEYAFVLHQSGRYN